MLTPLQAIRGGQIEATLADGRRVQIDIDPGLRAGDRLEVEGQRLRVGIAVEDALEIKGDDVWLTIPAQACGGRITAETPLGPRVLWIARGDFERGVLRYAGQGLPAHGRYRAGDLVLKLVVEGQETTLTRRRKGFLASWAA
jgi:DnaJ-class molecular chaperone